MEDQSRAFECKKLFEPLKINGMTLNNRIVMTAMHLNYTFDGFVSDQLIDFYRARAAGGAGLLAIGGCGIDIAGSGTFMLGLYHDKFIESLAGFVDAMKKENPDVRVCAQLYHAGRYSKSILTGQQPVSSTGGIGSRFNTEAPRELAVDEIPVFQQYFADAALRCKKAGFDCVEIIASAGYLICQFLSPAVNKRQDHYGGSFENRVRFGVETIQKTRIAVGKEYPIFVRLAGSDHIPGGHTIIESAKVAQEFEKAGTDAFNVTGGWHEAAVPQLTMSVPRGAYVYLAHNIKKAVSVPVVACNRINNPLLAERILREGKADLVGVARGLIADPEFPNKAKAGKYNLIRKCIACNQGCFDHVFMGLNVNCMVNYKAGREKKFEKLEKTDSPKKVVIAGGGPAGCEAAIIAAQKGHKVVLMEKNSRLGGNIHLCAAPPGRDDFIELTRYQTAALSQLDVEILLYTEATKENILYHKPDVVIMACGAKPVILPFVKEAKMENVFFAEDVLLNKVECFGDTVIIGGGAVGCETALHVSHKGRITPEAAAFLIETGAESPEMVAKMLTEKIRNVSIIEMLDKVGEDIGKSTRWTMMLDLKRSKVDILNKTRVLAIDKKGVLVKDENQEQSLIECENVVVATGYKVDNSLADSLANQGLKVHVIGDAKSPRRAIDAIEEGFTVAWNL